MTSFNKQRLCSIIRFCVAIRSRGFALGIGLTTFLVPGNDLSESNDHWAIDSKNRAFDAATEHGVWDSKLLFGGYAHTTVFPVESRLYVAIPSAGGGKLANWRPLGDTYVAFGLPTRATAPIESALFFREDLKEVPPEIPVAPRHLSNPDLILHRLGPGEGQIKISFHINTPNDPHYVWSGLCEGNWAVALEHKSAGVDLNIEGAKIVWRTKQAADRILYLVIKSKQDWLISDLGTAATKDWEVNELKIRQCKWHLFDPETIERGKQVDGPDLSIITTIGFTDLLPGGGSGACSRLDWIEVYGKFSRGG